MAERKRVLIIGATGHFGGRLCRRLLCEPNIELLVSSRRREAAELLARELSSLTPVALVGAVTLDQTAPDFESDLQKLAADIVIHTAGPYQGQDYQVAEACIGCGCHYIDLADGRDFVAGFDRLNDEARRRQLLLVTGASTLPGLSSCVIAEFQHRFHEIHAVEMSIAPAHQTPRGAGTISAVLSYCGRPFKVLSQGEWTTRYGWQNLRLQRYPGLGTRLSGACDVPDLGLLPKSMPKLKTVTFHAALEAKWEQLALWLMGWLTRFHLVGDWRSFVPIFQRMSDRLIKRGSDVGGMHIRLTGVEPGGRKKTLNWFLLAGKNHGPEIPCTPALILTKRLLHGTERRRGAVPCYRMFSLAEFDAEVGDLDIAWTVDGVAVDVRSGRPDNE